MEAEAHAETREEESIEANEEEILKRAEQVLDLPEELRKAIEAGPEELLEMDLSAISRELSKKIYELREVTSLLIEVRRRRLSELREQRAKRDELNAKVREVAQLIKTLRERRREIQQFINEKKNEGSQIEARMREIESRVKALENELKGFNPRLIKKLQADIERYETKLQTQILPDFIEKRFMELILRKAEQLKELKKKEEKYKELKKLRAELERCRTDLRVIRKSLAIYYEERRKIDEKIAELVKIRDERKQQADKYHQRVQEIRQEIEKINESLQQLRELRTRIGQTLRRISRLRQEKEEIRRKDELKRLIQTRLAEIRRKAQERGKLDYEDLEFLVEHGLLTDDFLEELFKSEEGNSEEEIEAELEEEGTEESQEA